MKYYFFSALTVVLFFTACKSNSPREAIINKWKVVNVGGDTPESKKREILNKTTIEFTKEGTYILSGTDHDQVGTYRFSDDNRWLVFKTNDNYSDSSLIELLTKTKLQLVNQDVVMTMEPK